MVSATDSQINICVSTAKNTSEIQHQKYDHDHLGNGFEFSPVVCGNDNSVLRCDQTETADDKFPSDDNDHNPCRKLVNLDHADHGRAYQKACLPADP